MRKGHYEFRYVKGLTIGLFCGGSLSLLLSILLFLLGGWVGLLEPDYYANTPLSLWTLFFLLLGTLLLVVNGCIHKLCEQMAVLLKEIEDRTAKR